MSQPPRPTATFFDKQHTSDLLELPLYFRLTRRWEVPRIDVAAKLLPPGEALLDVGCGDGDLVQAVAERYRRVVATDVAPAGLDKARARAAGRPWADRVSWMVHDANDRLPFADGEFTAVACIGVLQYVFDPEAFLAEARRVLAPGGHLLVEVTNVAFLRQRLRLLVGLPIWTSYYRHGIDGGNLHYFTVSVLTRLVRDAGFEVKRVTASGVFAPLRNWWLSCLSPNMFVLAEKPRPA